MDGLYKKNIGKKLMRTNIVNQQSILRDDNVALQKGFGLATLFYDDK